MLPRLRATDDARQPFLISGYAQEDLAVTLRRQAAGFMVAFVVTAVYAAFIGFSRFGAT